MKTPFANISKLLFVLCIAVSCNNQQVIHQNLNDLKDYVKAHRDSVETYSNQSWAYLDSGFNAQKMKLDNNMSQMTDEMKDSFNRVVADWTAFQNEYNRKREENLKIAMMDSLRNSLTLDGVRPDFTNVNADNILKQYEHFVDVVKLHKDTYTSDQWTVINVSWKSLNGRRREIEKELHKGDEGKILKLQLDYGGIKVANRPSAPND